MTRPPSRLALLALAVLLAAVTATAFTSASARAGEQHVRHRWDGRSHVAHEWGTFTGVQGSDGVALEGLRHEERDLPRFVYDLRERAAVTGVSPKMETPVVYLYSPDERRVHVRVRFPRGVITQWYPAAFDVNHTGGKVNGLPAAPDGRVIEDLRDGFIEWGRRQDLLVLGRGESPQLPPIAEDDPWRFSRQVDANALRVCNLNAARQEAGEGERVRSTRFEHESMLFYRGLGDFDLPLQGRVTREDVASDRVSVRVELTNPNPAEPLAHLFVVHVQDGRAGFAYIPSLADAMVIETDVERQPLGRSTETLVHALADRLTLTGLYRDEALAMARTWQHGYFQDEGLRVLFVLPTAFIDRELPLAIRDVTGGEAASFDVVRTFVGRMELLSPTREAELESTVHDFVSGDAVERSAAAGELDRWGRFAIPYLNRVLAMTGDAAVRAAARERLAALALTR